MIYHMACVTYIRMAIVLFATGVREMVLKVDEDNLLVLWKITVYTGMEKVKR